MHHDFDANGYADHFVNKLINQQDSTEIYGDYIYYMLMFKCSRHMRGRVFDFCLLINPPIYVIEKWFNTFVHSN